MPQRTAPLSRRIQIGLFAAAIVLAGGAHGVAAQTIDARQWQGLTAVARQSEQVLVSNQAEWRSLWTRVGLGAPDLFEPGRTNAVGIFLGPRGEGSSVNVISTSRRRDRIVVVFEERMPAGSDTMSAQRTAPRAVAGNSPSLGPGGTSFAAPGGGTAPPPAMASRTTPGPSTSPWAIVLINRSDLPISVEQRLFR